MFFYYNLSFSKFSKIIIILAMEYGLGQNIIGNKDNNSGILSQ